jgi:hypothetical protein
MTIENHEHIDTNHTDESELDRAFERSWMGGTEETETPKVEDKEDHVQPEVEEEEVGGEDDGGVADEQAPAAQSVPQPNEVSPETPKEDDLYNALSPELKAIVDKAKNERNAAVGRLQWTQTQLNTLQREREQLLKEKEKWASASVEMPTQGKDETDSDFKERLERLRESDPEYAAIFESFQRENENLRQQTAAALQHVRQMEFKQEEYKLDLMIPQWREIHASPDWNYWMNNVLSPSERSFVESVRTAEEARACFERFLQDHMAYNPHLYQSQQVNPVAPVQQQAPEATQQADRIAQHRNKISNQPSVAPSSPARPTTRRVIDPKDDALMDELFEKAWKEG